MRARRAAPGGSRRGGRVILLLAVLLAVLSLASLLLGSTALSPAAFFQILREGEQAAAWPVFAYVRLPRTLGAILAGAALAVSGSLLQVVLNNSLAGPNIIGVNAGAGFATVLFLALCPTKVTLLPAAAFIGAFCAAMLIYGIAQATGASRVTIVLAGVAVTNIVGAAGSAVKTLFPEVNISYSSFSVGSLANISLSQTLSAGGYIIAALAAAMLLSYELNILALGTDAARSLGLGVGICRFLFILLAAVLAGAAVSFAGLVGFLGLLAPHITRILVGPDNRTAVPAAALLGACALLAGDTLVRVVFAPYEVPVGLLLSFVGGIYFIYLLLHRQGGRLYA